MTPYEINTAIAEFCGWKPEIRKQWAGCKSASGWGLNQHLSLGDPQRKFTVSAMSLPNYYGDINAIHNAVCGLMDGQRISYVDQLLCVIHEVDAGYFNSVGWAEASDLITATAEQRSEALLRTIGKWTP